MGFAREAGTHAVFIHEGKVIEQGHPKQVISAPAHERTKAFPAKVL